LLHILARIADNKADAKLSNKFSLNIFRQKNFMDKVNIILEDYFDPLMIQEVIM